MFDLCHPGDFSVAAIFSTPRFSSSSGVQGAFSGRAQTKCATSLSSRGRGKVPQFFRIILEFLGHPECNSFCVSFRCHRLPRMTAAGSARAAHELSQAHLDRTLRAGVKGATDDRRPRRPVQAAQSSLVRPTASRAATRSAGSSSPASTAQSIQALTRADRSVGCALPWPSMSCRVMLAR